MIRDYLRREGAKEIKILTLYTKPWSMIKPNFYCKETSDWIVFPWEIKETLRKLRKITGEAEEPFNNAVSKLIKAGVNNRIIEHLLKEMIDAKKR